MKNRVLILTGIFPPDIGGPASYVPKVAKVLQEHNYEVTVGTYSTQSVDSLDNNLGHSIVRIKRSLPFIFRETWAFLNFFWMANKSDIIYANGQFFKAALIGLLLRKAVVVKIVGDEAWERSTNQGRYSGTLDEYQVAPKCFRLKYYDWLRTFPLLFVKSIIVPSVYLQNIVTGWGIDKSKVRVVYNGYAISTSISKEKYKNVNQGENKKRIVTICRLVPWKGVKQLIEVLPEISDAILEVVGDGPEKNYLQKLSQSIGVESRVKFWGNLEHKIALQKLSSADVFVLNSTYEGLPHVVLEAMGSKVPVVATLAGGTGELVVANQTGWPYNVGDRTQLVRNLRFVLDDNNKQSVSVFVESAYKMVENKFSETQLWGNTMRILQECIRQ